MSDGKPLTPKKDLRSVMAQAASALTIIPPEVFLGAVEDESDGISNPDSEVKGRKGNNPQLNDNKESSPNGTV
jgi:hypothetical protein